MNSGIVKSAIMVVMASVAIASTTAQAKGREPCSGSKGGVSHCENGQFVCNDGSVSQSKRVCEGKKSKSKGGLEVIRLAPPDSGDKKK